MTTTTWKRCSMCDKELGFTSTYYACSVSTCNRKRTGLYFCSVACWEAHLPMMRHRDAWAEERRAPTSAEWERQVAAEQNEPEQAEDEATPPVPVAPGSAPKRRVVGVSPEPPVALPAVREEELPREVLVVISKLKQYVRARSGMNTSDGIVDVLSDHLRALCNEAIRNAARDGRKTVMDRDFVPLVRR